MRGKIKTKRSGFRVVSLLAFLAATSPFALAQSPSTGRLEGWLTASQITATGAGSIGMWMKKLKCQTENDCAQKLVGAGDKYVLVAGKEVTLKLAYQPTDQKLVAGYAGTSVNIQGVLDQQKKTFEIEDIQSTYPEWMAGYLTAGQIASTGVNSIGTWMKKLKCQTEADCAQKLVKAGDKYVLLIGDEVFQLSDQKRAAEHAGMNVAVQGILNHKKKTIAVGDIEDVQDCG